MARQRFPEVVDAVDLPRSHDVVVHRAHLAARLRVLDQLDGSHDASCSRARYHRRPAHGRSPIGDSPTTMKRLHRIADSPRFSDRSMNRARDGPADRIRRAVMRLLTVVVTLLFIAVGSSPALAQTPTWKSHGPEGGSISALAVDPRAPKTLYAGSLGAGVFKTTNAAERWESSGPANAQVVTVAIDAHNTLGEREHPGNDESQDDGTPSNGASKNWPRGASAVVYVGTLGAGVFKSVDGGATWEARNSRLTVPTVRALVIDPTDSNVLYAGTSFGLFKSGDAGASWAPSDLTFLDVRALVIDPRDRMTLYAGTNSGVRKSVTGGATWTLVRAG